jgi:hypothetical protein
MKSVQLMLFRILIIVNPENKSTIKILSFL